MDPITLYGGLSLLTSSLATIVNVALDTKDGRKTLRSTLKELPILFDLLEEMREGVLKTELSIPPSAVRAFRACQTDLDNLIVCLTQRGLMGFQRGREGFSGLEKKLTSSDTFYSKLVDKEFKVPPRREHRSLKEKFNLMNLESLIQAVKEFKDSVLLLRHIAMDFKTHHLLYSQALDQQAMLEELQTMHAKLKQPPTTIQEGTTYQGEPNGMIAEETTARTQEHKSPASRGFRPSGTTRHSLGALSTISRRSNTMQNSPENSESKIIEPETYPTLFNVVVAIADPSFTPENSPPPQYICARTKLDTGSKRNLISDRMVSQYRFEYLKRRLDKREEWTVGDGKGITTSDYTIELTWFNTHDTMRSYRTKFHVVAPDIFDLLLGEEHYKRNGVPGYTTEYYLGFFDLVERPREQRRNENKSMKTAEAQAKEKLQQDREAEAVSVNASPVTATSLEQHHFHPNTTEAHSRPGRQSRQSTIDDRGPTLSPVLEQSPERQQIGVFMTPVTTTPIPEQVSNPIEQQKPTEAPTHSHALKDISSAPQNTLELPSKLNTTSQDMGTEQQKNAAPSLNASFQTIEGSNPVTPNEEDYDNELFPAATNVVNLVGATKAESKIVPIAGPSVQISV